MKKVTTISLQAIIFILVLQGCSSIPLSTMMKMSGFDENSFTEVTAEEVRVKVRSNTQHNVLKENVLRYQYQGSDGVLDESFSLELIEEDVRMIEHWFSDDSFEHSSVYQLDSDGRAKFKKLQQHPLINNKNREGKFKVTVTFKFTDQAPKQVLLSVDLLLAPEDGFFTLLDDHEFDLEAARKK
ncbi:hypothetical protein [Kangiella koreensis]|uniref:Lipoprotein n=1 Tax=Kangiella koreensis (strain DSM 16069 / JCM 12317 / KCTC 12182 / SW-125) TaxID=523791 RepID=C7RA82_KANKD|nr:hypothetical protein [Kangiella koreensis]ACV26201.1 conserved hypothetical protein [Kangiella koreensis DSM 16069]